MRIVKMKFSPQEKILFGMLIFTCMSGDVTPAEAASSTPFNGIKSFFSFFGPKREVLEAPESFKPVPDIFNVGEPSMEQDMVEIAEFKDDIFPDFALQRDPFEALIRRKRTSDFHSHADPSKNEDGKGGKKLSRRKRHNFETLSRPKRVDYYYEGPTTEKEDEDDDYAEEKTDLKTNEMKGKLVPETAEHRALRGGYQGEQRALRGGYQGDLNLRGTSFPKTVLPKTRSHKHGHGVKNKTEVIDPLNMFLYISLPTAILTSLTVLLCSVFFRPKGRFCTILFSTHNSRKRHSPSVKA